MEVSSIARMVPEKFARVWFVICKMSCFEPRACKKEREASCLPEPVL